MSTGRTVTIRNEQQPVVWVLQMPDTEQELHQYKLANEEDRPLGHVM